MKPSQIAVSLTLAFFSYDSALADDLKIGVANNSIIFGTNTGLTEAWSRQLDASVSVETYEDLMLSLLMADQVGGDSWDIVAMTGQEESILCSSGKIRSFDDLFNDTFDHLTTSTTCGVPYISYGQTIAYKSGLLTEPSSFLDFFDVNKFEGNRALPLSARGTLEMALLADGILPSDIYTVLATEQGREQAFEKLGTISGNIVWTRSGFDRISLLNDTDVSMAMVWSTHLNSAAKTDFDLRTLEQFMIVEHEYLGVVATSPDQRTATELLEIATSPAGLQLIRDRTEDLYSVPTVEDGFDPEDRGPALICQRNACPCASGGCDASCCNDELDSFGHFEINAAFWSQNEELLNKELEDWVASQ